MSIERLDLAASADFRRDPYPLLARLREEVPVSPVLFHGVPAWLVTRFADVETVFTDPRFSVDKAHAADEIRAVPWIAASELMGLGRAMIHVDPPDHTRLRRLVSKAFTPRRVESLRPVVESIVVELLDDLVARRRFDLLHDFSTPMAAQAIMVLLGAPVEDREEFTAYTHLFLSTDPADRARLPEALGWIGGYIANLVAEKSRNPADDLLSELIAARDAGDRLDDVELGSMTMLLLMAGFETTASLIANGALALIRNPDQLQVLRDGPGLMASAVEEMLRYDPTATASLPRYAKEDLVLGGTQIKATDAVVASWAAANRDPRRFDEPDRFDVRRQDAHHLAFAHGIHFCLGAPLARLEAQVAFTQLLARCSGMSVAVAGAELDYRVTPNIRGLTALPIAVVA